MHLQIYRGEASPRHFEVGHHWSIDLVTVAAAVLLLAGFVGAIVALWIH
jgi:hypothetical protein